MKAETINYLEEHIGSKIFDIAFNNIFLDMIPWARETK